MIFVPELVRFTFEPEQNVPAPPAVIEDPGIMDASIGVLEPVVHPLAVAST